MNTDNQIKKNVSLKQTHMCSLKAQSRLAQNFNVGQMESIWGDDHFLRYVIRGTTPLDAMKIFYRSGI